MYIVAKKPFDTASAFMRIKYYLSLSGKRICLKKYLEEENHQEEKLIFENM
jgi:hypothetical protein